MGKDQSNNVKGAQTHAEGTHPNKGGSGHEERHHQLPHDDTGAEKQASGKQASGKQASGKQDMSTPAPGEKRDGKKHKDEEQHDDEGKHRLFEGRQQHDDAEKTSEKTRLSRDIEEHGHDREAFQVEGGTENHPKSGDKSPSDRKNR